MNNKISFFLSKFNLVAALAILILSIPLTGSAQDITSAIRGTVTDESGSSVSSATVTITHTPTGTRRTVNTDANGKFAASGLRVGGPYTVRIESSSHQSASFENVHLSLAETLELNAALGGGTIEEVVVVASAIEATATSGGSSIFNRQFVEETAAFNRDLKDIAKRNPFTTILPGPEAPLSIAGINPAYYFIPRFLPIRELSALPRYPSIQ